MIDTVQGTVYEIQEKSLGLKIGPICIKYITPRGGIWQIGQEATIFTYLHWHAENGPSLFGFASSLERILFQTIIDCPKIGPSIATNILHQLQPNQLLEIITSQNEKALSSVNGIGAKKAEQLIVELKHKINKLMSSGLLTTQASTDETFIHWQQASEVLHSLNYSKQEISKALQTLAKKYSGQPCSLDQLIRSALTELSTPKKQLGNE